MDANLDLSRWKERPRGVGYRRWVIASAGINRVLRGKFCRAVLILAWIAGGILALAAFLFSQSVAVGGGLDQFLGNFGPRGAAIASTIRALVLMYPDVCGRTLFTVIFWLQSSVGLTLSLLTLTLVAPTLVTRDRSSNALTAYLSRPLTTGDYLLGKLGIIAGVIGLLWTGPLLLSWLLGVVFASDSDFFVYSLTPLLRALLFNGIGLIALAAIALGVSAVSRSARTTIFLWLGLWLVAGFVAVIPHMPSWMQCASFSHDLWQVRRGTLRIDQALIEAGQSLPFTNRQLSENLKMVGQHNEAANLGACVAGLIILSGLSSLVFARKLKAE